MIHFKFWDLFCNGWC